MAENKDNICIQVFMISVVYQCHKPGNFTISRFTTNVLTVISNKPTSKRLKFSSTRLSFNRDLNVHSGNGFNYSSITGDIWLWWLGTSITSCDRIQARPFSYNGLTVHTSQSVTEVMGHKFKVMYAGNRSQQISRSCADFHCADHTIFAGNQSSHNP